MPVRLALGAAPSSVAWLVAGGALRLVVMGAASGLTTAALLAMLVRSQVTGMLIPRLGEFMLPSSY